MRDNIVPKVAAVALAAGVVALPACRKTEKFPIEPIIAFKEFKQFADSASLVITFTDGDGDIGLAQGDTFPPYHEPPYFYNLFVDYHERQNGEWVRIDFPLPYYYRVPVITPTGQNKTLEGEIAVALKPWPVIPNTPGSPPDTVRFSVRLVDRALHESNTVFTPAQLVQ